MTRIIAKKLSKEKLNRYDACALKSFKLTIKTNYRLTGSSQCPRF